MGTHYQPQISTGLATAIQVYVIANEFVFGLLTIEFIERGLHQGLRKGKAPDNQPLVSY
jgi:hypothetical protein